MTGKAWWMVGGACALAFGGLVTVLTLKDGLRSASGQLDAVYAESKRLGLPLEAKDLEPNPPIPDSENASLSVEKAIESLKRVNSMRPKANDLEQLVRNGQYAELDAALTRFREPLADCISAVEKPRYWKVRDFDQGPVLLFAEYAEIKSLVRLLSAQSAASAHRGDLTQALASVEAARKLSAFLAQEPILIGMLVSIACDAISCRAYERLLTAFGKNPAALRQIEASLAKPPPVPSFRQALRGEVYLSLALLRNWKAFGGMAAFGVETSAPRQEIDYSKLKRTGLPEDSLARGYLTRCLEFWNLIWKSGEFNGPAWVLSRKMDAELQRIETKQDPSYAVAKILMPVFTPAGAACLKLECERSVLLGLARALIFRASHGRWPNSMEEAGAPLDPGNGKPLHIRNDGGGIRVYSVGPDGEDDRGLVVGEIRLTGKDPDRADIAAFYPSTLRQATVQASRTK